MRFGVHLPLADLGQGLPGGPDLREYLRTAGATGYTTIAANDHLLWRRPWLDGPIALASVLREAGALTIATSVALPTVRHPVVLAKALTSLAVLADGPVVAGLGPGSSAADHHAVGVPFEERWTRFDESLRLIRALVRGEAPPAGRFYPVAKDLASIRSPILRPRSGAEAGGPIPDGRNGRWLDGLRVQHHTGTFRGSAGTHQRPPRGRGPGCSRLPRPPRAVRRCGSASDPAMAGPRSDRSAGTLR
jgi:hypothetical protein